MKTCHKRKPKERTENLVDVWLCVPCVSEKETERGESCSICAFIMHILGGLTGIIVTVAAVHHQLIATSIAYCCRRKTFKVFLKAFLH